MLGTRLLLRQPACQLQRHSHSVHPPSTTYRPSARSFHATAPRRDPVLDAVLFLPHEMINLIHTAVPWYAAIPLSAFFMRALLVTTAGAWARDLTARYVGLHPLRQAIAFKQRQLLLQRGNFRTPKEATQVLKQEVKREVDALDREWKVGIKAQFGWTLAQIPIFFAMAETIRQKCAARDGLLGLTFSQFRSKEAAPASTSDGAVLAGSQDTPAWNESVLASSEGAGTVGLSSTATSAWFEPSLANEGILWFPDLLVPDPTGALPWIVGGLMFTNIYMTKNTGTGDSRFTKAIRFILLGMSGLVGLLCQELPSAVMLYWAGSTTSVMLWNAWLDRKYPAPKGFVACKRPLLMPPVPQSKGRRV